MDPNHPPFNFTPLEFPTGNASLLQPVETTCENLLFQNGMGNQNNSFIYSPSFYNLQSPWSIPPMPIAPPIGVLSPFDWQTAAMQLQFQPRPFYNPIAPAQFPVQLFPQSKLIKPETILPQSAQIETKTEQIALNPEDIFIKFPLEEVNQWEQLISRGGIVQLMTEFEDDLKSRQTNPIKFQKLVLKIVPRNFNAIPCSWDSLRHSGKDAYRNIKGWLLLSEEDRKAILDGKKRFASDFKHLKNNEFFNKLFKKKHYLTDEEVRQTALETGNTEKYVKKIFINKRAMKKKSLKDAIKGYLR